MHHTRLQKAQGLLKQWNATACLIEDSVDLYYLTGEWVSCGKLLFTGENAIFHTDGRYYDAIKKRAPLEVALYNKEAFSRELRSFGSLAFDAEKTSYARYTELQIDTKSLQPVASPLQCLRAVKDSGEIDCIREACRLTEEGYQAVQKAAKVGISEKKLAQVFVDTIVAKGADGPSFPPNVSFGEHGAYPHHHPDETRLHLGDAILVDLGARYRGYCADMTRVFFPEKSTTCKAIEDLYELAKRAYRQAAAACKEGVSVAELDALARKELAKEEMDRFFTHSLGHGVGLEIHEYPSLRSGETTLLQEGMVITIEPGLYLPETGGVRYENTLLVKKDGCENLLAL
ncbi:MAG: Xaa-Pro peptidase family protein [Chlamydiota bacterium]